MIRVHGVKQTIIKLNNLTVLNQHKIMGSVIYTSSKPMEDEQKRQLLSKTEQKTGNLVKSIGRKRVPIRKAKEIGTVQIGPRIGGGFKGHHGHLLEFGHKKVLWGRRTNERVKPYPFVEPAYKTKMQEVRNNMAKNLNTVLKRWAKTGKITVAESYD